MKTPLMQEMAAFATRRSGQAFPELARQRAVDAITDCFGCIIAGSVEDCATILRSTVAFSPAASGHSIASVLGGGFAAPSDAALCNGAAAHALDFDDTNHPAYAHPSAVLVPALLALAPLSNATGADIVNAYIIGLEMMGKLGRALNTGHYAKGWHATGTFGAPAAALAAGHLLGLSTDEIEVALSIAASGASGVRANFGSMIKPLHAGLAARTGVTSALLARGGYDAARDAYGHRFGYIATFRGAAEPAVEALRSPGEALEILTPYGLALKPNPACGATHPGIEAAAQLSGVFAVDRIKRVRVGVAEMALNPLIYDRPTTPLEAKFSMQYCVAAALLDGKVNLQTFTTERQRDPVLAGLLQRVDMEVDDRVRHDPEFATFIRIETTDGMIEERGVPLAKGKPERWLSRDELKAKFLDCARHGSADADYATRTFRLLAKLDSPIPAAAIASTLALH